MTSDEHFDLTCPRCGCETEWLADITRDVGEAECPNDDCRVHRFSPHVDDDGLPPARDRARFVGVLVGAPVMMSIIAEAHQTLPGHLYAAVVLTTAIAYVTLVHHELDRLVGDDR